MSSPDDVFNPIAIPHRADRLDRFMEENGFKKSDNGLLDWIQPSRSKSPAGRLGREPRPLKIPVLPPEILEKVFKNVRSLFSFTLESC